MTNKVRKLVASEVTTLWRYTNIFIIYYYIKYKSSTAWVTISVNASKAVKEANINFERMLKTDKKSLFCIR